MVRQIAAVLALVCVAATTIGRTQESTAGALELWDQAVAAKGGRDRLSAIRSFAIHEKTKFKRPRREFAVGKIDQIVSQLPEGWWEFLDYRPGKWATP